MSLHLVLLAALLAPALGQSLGFCDNFQVGVSNTLDHDVILETVESTPETHLLPARAMNAHDLLLGCTSMVDGEGFYSMQECHPPADGETWTISTSITVVPKTPEEAVEIHCVRILDRNEDGTGPFAVVDAGGVGRNYVNVTIYGQQSQGVRLLTLVYARLL